MRHLRTLGLTIALGLTSLAPVAVYAEDHRDDPRHHRYWDEEHHDYHRWNHTEDRNWRLYFTPERGPFITWERSSPEQRRAYWQWRHEHHR
jgi:hypothetical protein